MTDGKYWVCPECGYEWSDPKDEWIKSKSCELCFCNYKPNLRVTICLEYEGISDPNSTKADEIVELLGEKTTKGEWFGAKMCWVDEIEIVNEVSHE